MFRKKHYMLPKGNTVQYTYNLRCASEDKVVLWVKRINKQDLEKEQAVQTHPRHTRSCWRWSGLSWCWSRRSGLCEQETSSPRNCFQCAYTPGRADRGWWRTGSRCSGNTSWSCTWRPLCNLHTSKKWYYIHRFIISTRCNQRIALWEREETGQTKNVRNVIIYNIRSCREIKLHL